MSAPLALPDLCVPLRGSTTLRSVLSAELRRLLGDLSRILRAHARGPCSADVAELVRVVGPLARREPGALAAVVRRAEVAVWIRCLRPGAGQPVDPARGLPTLLTTIALELSRRGALGQPLRLRRLPSRILSGAARVAVSVPTGATALRFGPDGVVAELPSGLQPLRLRADDAAFVELPGTAARLALVDDNPLAGLEAHPNKQGNAIDLGQQPLERWTEALAEALRIIEQYLPSFRDEIEQVLQHIVPVGWDEQRHLSASIQEAIGTIYVSLHPNPMTMAEALVHEVSHNKLAALLQLDPVLENPREPTHASPVRPDPRPLHGVLLAVHALLPVAAMYAAMLDASSPGLERAKLQRRLAQVVRGNHEGAAVLAAHARPTALGRQLLDEIGALDERFGHRYREG